MYSLSKIYNDDFKKYGLQSIGFGAIFIILAVAFFYSAHTMGNTDINKFIYKMVAADCLVAGILLIYIALNKRIQRPLGIIGFLVILISNRIMNIVILFILTMVIALILLCVDRIVVTYLTGCIYLNLWAISGLIILKMYPKSDAYFVLYILTTGFLITYVLIGTPINRYILNKIYKVVIYDKEVLANHMYVLYLIVFIFINLSPKRFSEVATVINNSFVTLITMLTINKKGLLNQKIERFILKKDKENYYS